MEGPFVILIILTIGCILCGPIALVISIIALNRSKTPSLGPPLGIKKPAKVEEVGRPVTEKQVEIGQEERPAKAVEAEKVKDAEKVRQELLKAAAEKIREREKEIAPRKSDILEQRIGTRWILIAGVITVIFGVGFFLKYAYDNNWIGELGRVVIAAIAGLVALAVGEVTRRRGYGIVAKGVTALGFAILYAAVFSSYRFYELVDSKPAFVLAVLVTAAAMLYSVSLNEIVVAFLSLLGGFLTPVIVSTGENLPMPLFSYVLLLSAGAMLCAYYRKWRAIDFLAFVGTFLLYIGWFEKFYRPQMLKAVGGVPKQIYIALGWLGVFFVAYLILPMLYGLIKKVKAQIEDVLLVLLNAAVVFYYLWLILFAQFRVQLAFCALGLCATHLVVMSLVIKRYKEDTNLRLALLVIGLVFLTIAVPLYLKMYAIAMAWAIEGIVLAVIGLRYRSIWTQLAAAAALILSFGQLLHHLPMHTGAFNLILNPAFGTWCFVAAAVLLCHVIYRSKSELKEAVRSSLSQLLYAVAVLLLMAAISMEWYSHCKYNLIGSPGNYFLKGIVLIFAVFPLLFIIRPVCPRGLLCKIIASILAVAGSIFTMVAFTEFYKISFVFFANLDFGIVLIFVVSLFAGAWLLKYAAKEEQYCVIFSALFWLTAVFVLWVLLTEQIYLYWYCRNRFAGGIENWRFLSHMYISVMWAVYGAVLMAVGFWRKVKMLRYIAMGLFVLLLVKVFVLDTRTVKSVYRIAAFLATGVTLVAVSYLYQFVRRRGFFEVMLSEKNMDK